HSASFSSFTDLASPENYTLSLHDALPIYEEGVKAFALMRAGGGPVLFWVNMERLSSHTSSDDHKLYRSAEELAACEKCDPLKCWSETLIKEGAITTEEFAKLDQEIKERIRSEFAEAERAEDPTPDELLLEVKA